MLSLCDLFLMQNSIIEADSYQYHVNCIDQNGRLYFAVTHAVAYLFYPLLGWLSDVYFTRYKVIRLVFIIMCAGATVFTGVSTAYVLDIKLTTNGINIPIMVLPSLLLGVLSLGLFEANIIQLGMDQL